MAELTAVVKLIENGKFILPGEKFEVDDAAAEHLISRGLAEVVAPKRRRRAEQ